MWTYNHTAYPDELYHYGVLGMKWGVRKRQESSGPRTNWGRNRAYAKEQDALNKQMWKDTKQRVRSGKLNKKSAKYHREKMRYKNYKRTQGIYKNFYGMSKAARGKQMQKLGMSAKHPGSSKSVKETIRADQAAWGKQVAKGFVKEFAARRVGQIASKALVSAGTAYVAYRMQQMMRDNNGVPRLENNPTINLKPWQYKVSKK